MSVANYQKCLREYVAARWALDRLVTATQSVSRVLTAWKATTPNAVNGTLEAALTEFPTAQSLGSAIQRWKDTHRSMLTSWDGVNEDDRIGMVSPEGFQPPDEKRD